MSARPPRRDGVHRADAGTADTEGFIAPSIGALEHALYFTSAPSLADKTRQVIDEGRLTLPGAVIVWDETIGRRKGAKAVPGSWWAGAGSLTAAFVFPCTGLQAPERIARTAAAVLRAIEAFRPSAAVAFQPPNDLRIGGRKLGAIRVDSHAGADIAIVRVNCCADMTAAPAPIAAGACRLIDLIDARLLPLQQAGTLPNALLGALMREMPREFRRGR